jgi:hypothetical protein
MDARFHKLSFGHNVEPNVLYTAGGGCGKIRPITIKLLYYKNCCSGLDNVV